MVTAYAHIEGGGGSSFSPAEYLRELQMLLFGILLKDDKLVTWTKSQSFFLNAFLNFTLLDQIL